MRPRLILINLLLTGAILTCVWFGRARWNEAQAVRRSALEPRLPKVSVPPPAVAPRPEAPQPAKYVDVATSDLFSKDRNPTVVIEAPKIEKPREMPHLPVVYGVLGLPSGVKALMSEKPGAGSQSVRAGDSIGEFKIAALDPQNVTFLWEDREIHKKIEELMDRNSAPGADAAAGPQPAMAAQNNRPPPPPPTVSGPAALGVEIGTPGRSERACRPGDNSPADTVIDGYKKVLLAMPFGINCRWVPVQ